MARSGGDALRIQENRGLVLQGEQFWDRDSVFRNDSKRQSIMAEKYGGSDTTWMSKMPSCPVFSPSLEEFEDPLAYISSIAPAASKYGICKIIPPLSPSVPAGKVLMKEKAGFKFHTRVQAMRLSNWDLADKVTFLISAQRYTFQEFEKVANKFHSRKFSSAAIQPPNFVETEFWKGITSGKGATIEYASDVDGSAFSMDPEDPLASSSWNLKAFSCLSKSTLRFLESKIPGVTEPMLYIGMLFSMFAWHVEDHYLYSINYHHCGAPKTWYGVPGDACQMFENVVKERVYDPEMLREHGQGAAFDLLIGKTTMFPPSVLLKHGVPVYRAVQAAGEFVITFPRSYHAGFSHGFNCGEAVNFAMADWFPFGAAACRRYSLLNRMPLLPHEELLWKEAAALAKRSDAFDSAAESVKVAFVRLMSFHHRVRWLLNQRGASLCVLSDSSTSVSCMLCKHVCHISFISCKCFPEPTCLNHAAEMRKCQCGNARRLILNKRIVEMEELACEFRSSITEGAGFVVKDGMSHDENLPLLEEDLADDDDYSSYVPFAKIDVVFNSIDTFEVIKEEVPAEAIVTAPEADVKKVKPGVAVRRMPEKRPLVHKQDTISNSWKSDALRSCFKHKKAPDCNEGYTGHVATEGAKCPRVKVFRTPGGDLALRLKDIAYELKRFRSAQEIMRLWQIEAQKRGLRLDYSMITDANGQHLALSYTACQRFKSLLTESEAVQLENLFNNRDKDYVGGASSVASGVDFEDSGAAKRTRHTDSKDRASSKRLREENRERSYKHQSPQTDHSVCMSSSSTGEQDFEGNNNTNNNRQQQQQQHDPFRGRLVSRCSDTDSQARLKGVLARNSDRSSSSGGMRESRPRLKIKGPSLPLGGEGCGENLVQALSGAA